MDKLDEAIRHILPQYMDNYGHGHVWPRPDKKLYRCGGNRYCDQCKRDLLKLKTARLKLANMINFTKETDNGQNVLGSGPTLRPQVDGEVASLGYN